MKIEEIKSGKIISEQVSYEDNQSVNSTDESPKVKIEKVNTQSSVSKRTFMGYEWSAWFPKSTGLRRLLLVLAIIVYVCFVAFFIEVYNYDDFFGNHNDFKGGCLIMFLVFLGELVVYMTIVWVYRGFKKE